MNITDIEWGFLPDKAKRALHSLAVTSAVLVEDNRVLHIHDNSGPEKYGPGKYQVHQGILNGNGGITWDFKYVMSPKDDKELNLIIKRFYREIKEENAD